VEQRLAALTVLGSSGNTTNVVLARELSARGIATSLVPAAEGLRLLRPGDVAFARLDVLPTLDGIEPGMLAVLRLERRGVRLVNGSAALLRVHDKLRSARVLAEAGLPHPRTIHLTGADDVPDWSTPFVVKPRFGSWGRDVLRCSDRAEGRRVLAAIHDRPWFRRHGALAQQLLPARGYDLRLIVARGKIIGGANRRAAPGEWRTNVSLGGTLEPVDPPPHARALACAAAAGTGIDVVGVDLLPLDGGYAVLELNGAVDFDERYSIGGRDVWDELIAALALPAVAAGV